MLLAVSYSQAAVVCSDSYRNTASFLSLFSFAHLVAIAECSTKSLTSYFLCSLESQTRLNILATKSETS